MKLILLLSLFSLNLQAKECQLQANGPIVAAYHLNQPNLNCDYIQEVEKVFFSVQEFSEEKLSVNLMVREKFDNASFDGGSIIEVPEQLIFSGQYGESYPASLDSNLVTVAHEYGHALLAKKIAAELSKEFPEIKKTLEKEQEISNLNILISENPSQENKDKLHGLVKELKSDAFYLRYSTLTSALSELYADVVAVYNDERKGAIMYALYYNELSDRDYKFLKTRDFDTEFDSSYNLFLGETHAYYALTRNYIGKNLWPNNTLEKKQMLKKIGDAVVLEVKNLLQNNRVLPNPIEGNNRLIERLKQKLRVENE